MRANIGKGVLTTAFLFAAMVVGATQADAGQKRNLLAQAVSSAAVDLQVTADCKKGAPVFKIANVGETWPRASRFAIIRVDDNKVFSKRSMRMKSGQNASFKVPAKHAKGGEFAIKVLPTWYERKGNYDARIACN